MSRPHFRLALALIASLLSHLLPFISELVAPRTAPLPPPSSPVLTAELRPPPRPAAPPLMLPDAPRANAAKPKQIQAEAKPAATSSKPRSWEAEVSKQFRKQAELGLYYPAEAIIQGLQGEVIVLMIIGENGQISAARIEQSSGHRLLDEAALRAVRALRSLPATAPREALLPVRFSLK
jgi:protein TonB